MNKRTDFYSDFNYPEEIKALLKDIVEVLSVEGVISIMALGSLPKGELSYRTKFGSLELFSDIELMVVTEEKVSREKQTLLKESLKSLEKKLQPSSPLFNITVEFVGLVAFRKLPHKVRFYELRESGRTLFGPDIRDMIPKVYPSNLHIEDTNNIILRRLLSMLLYFPREIFNDKEIDMAHDAFKYTAARNALDIATVLLFQKGIFLPTYREKTEYIVSNLADFRGNFGKNFPQFLAQCFKIKLNMDFNQSLITLFGDTLKYFKLLLVYILKSNEAGPGTKKSLSSLTKKSRKDIFGERDITTVKFNFILKSPNLNMLQKRLRALSYSFMGCVVFFLLNMNESAYLFLKGDKKCLSVLDNAWWVLMRLGVLSGNEPLPIDYINRFLILRERFFYDFYAKFMAPAEAARINEVLDWRYE